jgi:hypothetical protein
MPVFCSAQPQRPRDRHFRPDLYHNEGLFLTNAGIFYHHKGHEFRYRSSLLPRILMIKGTRHGARDEPAVAGCVFRRQAALSGIHGAAY